MIEVRDRTQGRSYGDLTLLFTVVPVLAATLRGIKFPCSVLDEVARLVRALGVSNAEDSTEGTSLDKAFLALVVMRDIYGGKPARLGAGGRAVGW